MQLKSLIKPEWLLGMQMKARNTPDGCFVEVGVYQGGSAEYLYNLAIEQRRKLHLFDTFEGIPHKTEIDRHCPGDFSDAHLDTIKAALPKAIFHVGVFPETLTDDVRDIAFIHVDVDQYESQKAVNRHLWPRVVPGGAMMIDDYYILDGIRQAIDEDFPGRLIHWENQRPFLLKEPAR